MYILLYLNRSPTRTCRTAQGTLLDVMWQPGWEGSLGENGYMYIHVYPKAESLCCSPETITAFLIGYTPKLNKKFFQKKKLSVIWMRGFIALSFKQGAGIQSTQVSLGNLGDEECF